MSTYSRDSEFTFLAHPAIPEMVMRCLLFADFRLISSNGVKQIYARNAGLAKLAFYVSGGIWDKCPLTVTIKYLMLPGYVKVSYQWQYSFFGESTPSEMTAMNIHSVLLEKQINDYVNEWLKTEGA